MNRSGAWLSVALLLSWGPARSSGARAPAEKGPIDLDVLFVGAHPDDEAWTLPALGQWNEDNGLKTGVVTITRGEGGGNAAGLEEGPELGLLREAEERRAVGRALIENVYNLDAVDFYYTVSAPLTERIWGHEAILEKVARIVRLTRPEVIITMNPAPSPGNHGNHQYAARLAIEAFQAAADPKRFPDQVRKEGLEAFRVRRIFRSGASGSGPHGSDCAATFKKEDRTETVASVWQGTMSRRVGKTWARIGRDAAVEYVSQGWGGEFPSSEPGCNRFTQIASRVPHDPESTAPTGALEGALVPAPGALPRGTELYLTRATFDAVAGEPFPLTVHVRATGRAMTDASVSLSLPDGWAAVGNGRLVSGPAESTATFTVTPPAGVPPGRFRIGATLTHGEGSGRNAAVVRLVPAVQGRVERLPQVAQFEKWARDVGVPQLGSTVKPVLSLGVGETRTIRVDLRNWGARGQAGSVSLVLPAGFSAIPASRAYTLAAGADASVTFDVTNRDTALPTANQGGAGGDYDAQVVTTSGAGTSSETFGLELVPVTTIPRAAAAPVVDGTESPGEYAGPALDLGRVWEGSPCASAADCSGNAKLTWYGDDLYLLVNVRDDLQGSVVTPADCKRHWRTDSVEIALDPRGASENTSTTFKAGLFPVTADPARGNPACFERDADNHQGPGAETAPGMVVASKTAVPYAGYALEVKIPLGLLPSAVDPERLGLNLFICDSDTQDLSGQTRLGWSTFGGVQGDPYRWGRARLAGYAPPAGRPTVPPEPVIPRTAALSVDSPQSILQSALDGVPLGGGPAAAAGSRLRISSSPTLTAAGLTLGLSATGAGRAHVFAWTGTARVAELLLDLAPGPPVEVTLPLDPAGRQALERGGRALISFTAAEGGTRALQDVVR
jgi:LmbE family N-acetylglucosaminyl deacetylase